MKTENIKMTVTHFLFAALFSMTSSSVWVFVVQQK